MKKFLMAAFLCMGSLSMINPASVLQAQEPGDITTKYKMVMKMINPCLVKFTCTNVVGDQCSHKGACFMVSWCILY